MQKCKILTLAAAHLQTASNFDQAINLTIACVLR